jgi:hypothetical protein
VYAVRALTAAAVMHLANIITLSSVAVPITTHINDIFSRRPPPL